MNFTKATTSLFSLTFENIIMEDSRLIGFLLQLSFIAVPVEFMFQEYFLVAQSRGEPLPSFYQLFVYNNRWSSALFLRAVQRLATYSIVREELVGESGVMILSIHRLVKQALQTEGIPAGIDSDCQLMLQATAIIAASLSAHDWEELSVHQRPMFRESILECVKERKCMNNPYLIKRYSGISEGYQTTFAAFLSMYSNEENLAKDLLLQSLSLQSTWFGESAFLTCTTMTWLSLLYLESMSLAEAEVMIDRLYIAQSQAPQAQNIFLVDVQLMQGHLQMRRQKIDDAVSIFQRCTELYANVASISSVGTASALVSGVEAMLMQGNVEEATQSLYEAEHIQKDLGSARALAIRVKWNTARHSLRMGDHIRATSRYKDLCEEHESNHDLVGPSLHRWESLHCELGDVYLDLGDVQKATAEYDIGRASASRISRSLEIDSRDISQWLLHGSLERTKFVPYLEG
jgi:tetratricopeptide (TPR) repeat protein